MRFNIEICDLQNIDKNEIISNSLNFITYIAKKVKKSYYYLNLETDELVSYGVLGLIEAIDRYDVTKKNKFKTYAEFRIRGAMLDYIRSLDKTPRSIREKEKVIEKAKAKLESEGEKISHTKLAEELGLNLDEFYRLLDTSNSRKMINLEDYLYGNQRKNKPTDFLTWNTPEKELDVEEQKNLLRKAMQELSLKEQQILDLYYVKELNLKEIAYIMEISESRVSQINKASLKKLRVILAELMDEENEEAI